MIVIAKAIAGPSSGCPEATKGRIIAYGSALFSEQGIRAITTKAIASGAHVSKKTLYRCFRNKEELVSSIILAWMEEMLESRDQAFCDRDGSLLEHIASILRISADLIPHLQTRLICQQERGCFGSGLVSRVQEMQRSRREQLARLLREAQTEGLMRDDLNPDHWVHLFVRTIAAVLKQPNAVAGGQEACEVRNSLLSLYLDGVLTDKGHALERSRKERAPNRAATGAS